MNERSNRVLVTARSLSRSGHPALDALSEAGYKVLRPWPGVQPTEDQLLEVLPSCVATLAGVEPITERVLTASAGSLRIISRFGVGLDNIDMAAAERLGIHVAGTPGANAQGVAELALALMFNGLRAVSWSDSRMKQGEWSRRKGIELEGKTLGIIGCGNIGKRLARMAIGVGMRVMGYDLYPDERMTEMDRFRYTELDRVMTEADVISLHCPPGDKPLLDSVTLSRVRSGVVIVNTARDALIDHGAMLEALENGRVTAYATDVYDREPPELDELLLHDRVVMTPHIGGFTEESVDRTTVAAVNTILDALK